MGSVGDAYDNAMCEGFFLALEAKLRNRRTFTTKAEARMALLEVIEGCYNPGRRNFSLGYMSLINSSEADWRCWNRSPVTVHETGEVQFA
jgi:putative transposase